MTRREKIIAYLTECKAVQQSTALTTNEIASALNIYRSNVSKELNQLVRAGIVSKRAGRPVRYWLGGTNRVFCLTRLKSRKLKTQKLALRHTQV